jgi:hypothetical protein
MLDHHQRAIDKLAQHFQNDPGILALIVSGSVAKGLAQPNSDVDFMLLATDEEFARRQASNTFTFFSLDFTDYPGGYVDGKIVSRGFLDEVADHGSEPARWAFTGAYPVYSRVPDLADLLRRLVLYPEQERTAKIQSFYAQVQALKWFMSEAEKRDDPYLRMHAAADMVLFGGRLILAHNRVLYPYHKWFMTELARAPEKPEGLIDLAKALLAQPNQANTDAFADAVLNFTTWEAPPEGWPMRFMTDVEWTWRNGRPAVEDL